jgi:tetratricopeptide (TPR) repeat protein
MVPQEHTGEHDRVAAALRTYAQNILTVIFGLLPLIFIPTAAAPFEYTKVFAVALGAFLALILWGLSILRAGAVRLSFSYALGALWLVALAALVSGLLSGDRTDALVGDLFSIHSTVFVALLALVPSVWMLLRAGKGAIMRMYTLLGASTIILVLFHVIRIIFGANALSFGLFTSNVATPVGSWNDLGLFLGLVIILSLVALEQLSLTKVGKIFFGFVTLGGLFMLAIINFFTVWIILGLASLVMIVFTLGRDPGSTQLPLMNADPSKARGTQSLWQSLVVFLVAVLFVVGGSTLGGWISNATGISYVEVRPSFGATMDVARAVYHENAFLGAGTNRFADVWRMYKDDSINSTVFWNTDFNAGSGYISTFFVTTGVLGGCLWLLFLITYAVTGIRRLLSPSPNGDRMWYFIALSSFLSAVYVWGISVVYVPGATILLLGALCTGISLHAFNVLSMKEGRMISVVGNRRGRFVLTLAVVLLIITSVGLLYLFGRHYSAVYSFNASVAEMQAGGDIAAQEGKVAAAFELFSSDIFARRVAEYQLAKMNSLVALENPTEADQQQFNDAVSLGINAAQIAIQNDPGEPANWSLLGNIYGVLASVNVEGAYDKALETLNHEQELNPKNPLPYLELAIVEARAGKTDAAREHINKAIEIKPNFVDAFFLLSQLEIANGNTDAAIQSTQATITLEPDNPARYYQLGVLARAKGDTQLAITALEHAVALDENFANARYHLALAYDEAGRSADAKAQLEAVLKLNPGNEDVTNMIDVLDQEGSLASLRAQAAQTVSEQEPVTAEDGTVHTTGGGDSSLVTPVNTPPQGQEAAESSAEAQTAE